MKKTCIAALMALALASCGGGGSGGGTGSANSSSPATASTEGLWSGTIQSSVSGHSQPVTMIFLPTGEARIFENNCVQFVALTSMTGAFFAGSGNAYAPDGGIAACPVAVTFPDGTQFASITLSGEAITGQQLIGSYSGGGDQGNFNVAYNDAYERPGTLARIAGTYSNGTMNIVIDSTGAITGTLGTFSLTGQVSTIDPTKNAYRITITEVTTTTTASATAASGTVTTSTTGSTWAGLTTLIDYPPGTDNYLVSSLANQTSGFEAALVKQ